MKKFIVVGGVNGSGKTSFFGAISKLEGIEEYIDLDKYMLENSATYYKAARVLLSKTEKLIKEGKSFSQESTLSGYQIFNTIEKAKENGYYVHLYYIGLDSPEEAINRVANRVLLGGHNIPAEDIRRRFSLQKERLYKALEMVDEADFFDNVRGFTPFATYKNKKWLLNDGIPQWFLDLELKKFPYHKKTPNIPKEMIK